MRGKGDERKRGKQHIEACIRSLRTHIHDDEHQTMYREMKRSFNLKWVVACCVLFLSCETSEPIIESPGLSPSTTIQPTMSFSVSEVTKIRSEHNVDQRVMPIEGVLSVGIAGKSNDDAWIQVQCKDTVAVEKARTELGDSLAGVPIHFTLAEPFEAQ